jgi:hypothetical protein
LTGASAGGKNRWRKSPPKDEIQAERSARFKRIGKSLAKTIRNMLAGVPGEKLRVKGYRWVPEKKEPPEKRQLISADVFAW